MYVQPLTLPPIAEDPEEARVLVQRLLKAPVHCHGLTRVLQVDFTRNEFCSEAYIDRIAHEIAFQEWRGEGWLLSFVGGDGFPPFLDGPSIP